MVVPLKRYPRCIAKPLCHSVTGHAMLAADHVVCVIIPCGQGLAGERSLQHWSTVCDSTLSSSMSLSPTQILSGSMLRCVHGRCVEVIIHTVPCPLPACPGTTFRNNTSERVVPHILQLYLHCRSSTTVLTSRPPNLDRAM